MKSKIHEILSLKNIIMSKKTLTILAISSLILTSCGSDKKENVADLPAIPVEVAGNTEN